MAENINIAQLAEYCKVSQATVSRVFSGTAPVREKTREKILDAARKLNYTPQQTARKDNIAIIVPTSQAIEPPSWFAAMMATALMREIYRAGYIARLYEAGDIQLIQPNFTVAAIVLNWRPGSKDYEKMVSLQRPVIMVNYEDAPFSHSVSTDHAQGIRMAIDYLVKNGHRKIGLLNCQSENWGNREREFGYRNALAAHGIDFNPDFVSAGMPEGELSLEGLSRVVNHGVTALISAHEDWTMEIHHHLNSLGRKVPDDISVIAAEVPGLSCWLNPPYTSLAQDAKTLAHAALEILEEIPRNSSLPATLLKRRLPYQLIERNSVKKLI